MNPLHTFADEMHVAVQKIDEVLRPGDIHRGDYDVAEELCELLHKAEVYAELLGAEYPLAYLRAFLASVDDRLAAAASWAEIEDASRTVENLLDQDNGGAS